MGNHPFLILSYGYNSVTIFTDHAAVKAILSCSKANMHDGGVNLMGME